MIHWWSVVQALRQSHASFASAAADHTHKLRVLTRPVCSTSTQVYLHCRITERCWSNYSPGTDLLFKCAVKFSAPSIWNLLLQTFLISDSLPVFKSRLQTFLFKITEHWSDLPPVPLKLRQYGAIEIWLLLYYYYYGISSKQHIVTCATLGGTAIGTPWVKRCRYRQHRLAKQCNVIRRTYIN